MLEADKWHAETKTKYYKSRVKNYDLNYPEYIRKGNEKLSLC
jgi:hypothetical protein